MSFINVNDVCDFVNNKTFDEIKLSSKMLYVKEQNNLYLLANNNKIGDQNETNDLDRRIKTQANGIIFEKGNQ